MRVALVYDRVTKWGGAERVLLTLHNLWPDAPLYTAVYDKKRARWADVFEVRPSFLQHIPFANKLHELLPWITPMAFESFSFDEYDVVISVTSAEAKSIITKPGTIHICYCLTPTRYLWSGFDQYQKNPGMGTFNGLARLGLSSMVHTLRAWDLVASSRPDYYVAISRRVQSRIQKYYHRDVDAVVYPPVDTNKFRTSSIEHREQKKGQYFLTVSRLVGYKRVDLIVAACNRLGLPLVVVGHGYEKKSLQHLAGKTITFVDAHLTDSELVRYYQECCAFVYAADEDFGIAMVEAQASGKPVIAYGASGARETVIDGKTGILYDSQDVESLTGAIKKFQTRTFDPNDCIIAAAKFDTAIFTRNMKGVIETLYRTNHI